MKFTLHKPRKVVVHFFLILVTSFGIAGAVAVTPLFAGNTYGWSVTTVNWDGWFCYPWSGVTGGVTFGSCDASTVGGWWQTTTCLDHYICGDSFDPFNCGNIVETSVECVVTGCTPDNSCAATTLVGDVCSDTCGGWVPGTKPLPTCADTGQSGIYPFCFTPSPCTVSSACGSNTGVTIDYSGTCSVSAPALPPGYGTSCQSADNSCGMHNPGTIDCSAGCNATTPPDSACIVPPPLVASCTVSPTFQKTMTPVVWSATASGGTGVYSYTWTGTQSLGGSGASLSFLYPKASGYSSYIAPTLPDPDTASVTVVSGGQTVTKACSNTVKICGQANEIVHLGSPGPYPPVSTKFTDDRCCSGAATTGGADHNNFVCTASALPGFKPELTASDASVASSPVAGVPVVLTSTISNSGKATATGFTDFFQWATDDTGAGATDIVSTAANPILAHGATFDASVSHAFPAGTWYIRACADKNAAGDLGVIAEMDETNNCSLDWIPITVSAAPSPSVTCTVSPGPYTVGPTYVYTATPSGGATGPYTWIASDGATGLGSGSTASRSFGSGSYDMDVKATGAPLAGHCPRVTTTGGACTMAGPVKLSASPSRIRKGQSTTLKWEVTDMPPTGCVITGPSGFSQNVSPGSCALTTGTVPTPVLANQSVYVLTCPGPLTAQAVVNVSTNFWEF